MHRRTPSNLEALNEVLSAATADSAMGFEAAADGLRRPDRGAADRPRPEGDVHWLNRRPERSSKVPYP